MTDYPSDDHWQYGDNRLYYVHDPMCSWCWAFAPVWNRLVAALEGTVRIETILGGLAPDAEQPMPGVLREKIRGIWQVIEIEVPGTRFNFDFWEHCTPRRSTYPACRAVIAASRQAPELEAYMIHAIQQAYYLEARNPSDHSVLIDLASGLGLDMTRFSGDLNAPETRAELDWQIAFCRKLGVAGFPSLVLSHRGREYDRLRIDYRDPNAILKQIEVITGRIN